MENRKPIAAVMIHAPDWKEGFAWYQQAFPKAEVVEVNALDWKYLEIDGIGIEIVNSDEEVPSGVAGTVVYWHTDDFDARLKYLNSIGAKLYRGPMVIEGNVRMCQVKDPFGNVFGLRELAQS